MLNFNRLPWCLAVVSGLAAGQTLNCNLSAYKPIDGLKAEVRGGALDVAWRGEGGQQLRADFAIREGRPQGQELAARKTGGQGIVLANGLQPELPVTSGRPRPSQARLTQLQ